MKKLFSVLIDLALLGGIILVSYGIYSIYAPLMYIFIGIFLVYISKTRVK